MGLYSLGMSKNRIDLRPFRPSDLHSLIELGNNHHISDNLSDGFPHPYTVDSARKFLNEALEKLPVTRMAITLNEIHVGNIGLDKQSDIYSRTAEIGYFIGESYWGRGIATKAIEKIVKYGFDELDIVRIFADVFDYNKASMRVLEKNGFELEGISRKGAVKNGVILDLHQYAIINPAYC